MSRAKVLDWILRTTAAAILFQTLFFKFSAARESVYIFSTLGAEPWGRIGVGVLESIACILLLFPRTAIYGAALSTLAVAGAIAAHLTVLGIALSAVGDHGELFTLAVIVLLCSVVVLVVHRREIPFLNRWLTAGPVSRNRTIPLR